MDEAGAGPGRAGGWRRGDVNVMLHVSKRSTRRRRAGENDKQQVAHSAVLSLSWDLRSSWNGPDKLHRGVGVTAPDLGTVQDAVGVRSAGKEAKGGGVSSAAVAQCCSSRPLSDVAWRLESLPADRYRSLRFNACNGLHGDCHGVEESPRLSKSPLLLATAAMCAREGGWEGKGSFVRVRWASTGRGERSETLRDCAPGGTTVKTARGVGKGIPGGVTRQADMYMMWTSLELP